MLILPFIEQSELHDEYNFGEPWDGPNNRKLANRMPRMFAFHGSERGTTTNYFAVVGDETAWPGTKPLTATDVSDGLGKTILIAENQGSEIHWMEPRDLLLADMNLTLNTPDGLSSPYDDPAAVMLDGSIYRFRSTLRPETLRALLTINGGEPLQTDDTGGWQLLTDGRLRPRR